MERRQPNFRRWILGIISVAICFQGPVIIALGYQAYNFNVKIFTADRALMGMGGLLLMHGLITLIGTIAYKSNILLFSFYSNIILNIFNAVLAVGAYLMVEDLAEWIDSNWEDLRKNVSGYDMNDFKEHVASEIQSLVAFASIVAILLLLALPLNWSIIAREVKQTLLPVTSLILSILGSALVVVSIYSTYHSLYTQLPLWTSFVFTVMGLIEVILGVFGYRAAEKKKKDWIAVYAGLLGLASMFILVAGIGYLLNSGLVVDYLQEDWQGISANLQEAGY